MPDNMKLMKIRDLLNKATENAYDPSEEIWIVYVADNNKNSCSEC